MGRLEKALDVAVEAARAAGTIARKYFHGTFDVTMKSDQTPVTQADREAEQAITAILRDAFPDHGILGEEFGAEGSRERRWIIDPIDGTRNFVRRIPIWATLIGLEEEGEITVGVVHTATGEMYTAVRGGGAYRDGQRLHVSDESRIDEAFLVHASLTLVKRAGCWDRFMRLVDATGRQRGFGDYIGYTLVAEAKCEIYCEVDLKPWDLAPCKLLVEEAGGRFTDWNGRPTIYSGSALATNGRLHDAALALVAR